jgi:hypothetical protein
MPEIIIACIQNARPAAVKSLRFAKEILKRKIFFQLPFSHQFLHQLFISNILL